MHFVPERPPKEVTYYWKLEKIHYSAMDRIHDTRDSEQYVILIIMTLIYNVVDVLSRIVEEIPLWTEHSSNYNFNSSYFDDEVKPRNLEIQKRISENGTPELFFAQGEWAMVGVPPYEECNKLIFVEWITKQNESNPNQTIVVALEKQCIRSERRTWFWVYAFTPEREHELEIFDAETTMSLLLHNFTSLPELPPDIDYVDITGGAGWILVKIMLKPESDTNLIGYDVYYRREKDSFWWRSYIDTVIYGEDYPYVRPVHYCLLFRTNGTMCLLVSDGVWFDAEMEFIVKYEFRIKPYRIYPGGKTMGNTVRVQYLHKYCDWEKMDCYPPVDKDFQDFNISTTTKSTDTTSKSTGTTTDDMVDPNTPERAFGISTTLSPEWWLQNTSQSRPSLKTINDDDIFVICLGLLLIALAIIPPCAVCLGRRSGHQAAAKNWTKMSSKRGSVHIPLRSVA